MVINGVAADLDRVGHTPSGVAPRQSFEILNTHQVIEPIAVGFRESLL